MARVVSGLPESGPAAGPANVAGAGRGLAYAGLLVWTVGVFTQELFTTVGVVALALGAARMAWPRRAALASWRSTTRAWWPLWAFFLWALLGPLLGGRLPSGTGAVRHLEWLLIPVAGWVLVQLPPRWLRTLIVVGVASLLASSVAAGLQHFGLWPPSESFRPFAWTRIPFNRVYEPAPGTEGRFLAGGLVFHRLKFAHVGSLAVAAFAAWAVNARGRARAGLIVGAVVGGVAVALFPSARAAAVAMVAGVAVAVGLGLGRRLTVRTALAGAGALLLLMAAAASYAPVRARLLSSFSKEGSGARDSLRRSGLNALAQAPLTGLGLGRFRVHEHLPPDAPPYVQQLQGKAHNQFLSMAAEIGIPGAVLFVALLAWLLARLWRQRAAAGVGALAIFVLLSITHDPLFHPQFALALFLLVAAGLAVPGRAATPEPS